jgi:uncharacterized protein (TIGR02001 family)
MKKPQLVALTIGAILLQSTLVFAAEEKKPEPDWKITGNMALSSEYLYRGIKQTNGKPAISGGFDVSHVSGFYAGNWNSNISWISDAVPGVSAPIESDIYGGYKFEVIKDVTLDLGALYYWYPTKGVTLSPKPSTLELYVAPTYGPATLKYSYATSELFGLPGSKKSSYIDLSASFDVGAGITLTPHVGHQQIKTNASTPLCLDGSQKFSYTDYSLKAAYDLSGWTLAGTLGGTNAKKDCYTGVVSGTNLGKTALVVSIGKSF